MSESVRSEERHTSLLLSSHISIVWSVLCAVRSTTQFKWYLNGVLSGTTANPYGTLATTAANITIGNGYAGFWQGDMAMVTAYTRALTDAEVAQNFAAQRSLYNV